MSAPFKDVAKIDCDPLGITQQFNRIGSVTEC
jgi:hypothetical protein